MTQISDERSKIKLAVSDFGTYLTDPESCGWVIFLRRYFDIEICGFEDADFLLYSSFGFKHANFKGVKIFCTEENRKPDWSACDYAFTHEVFESDRHLRVPCYVLSLLLDNGNMLQLTDRQPITHEDLKNNPRKFCNFIYRNKACKTRNRFFAKLSKYKKVDSAGSFLNNMGKTLGFDEYNAKTNFQQQYKFTIAFENEAHTGYLTEKLPDALRARTVPIYWGDPRAPKEFNTKAYLNYYDFASEEELIKRIIEIDGDDDLFLEYVNAPVMTDVSRECLDEERIVERFRKIFASKQVLRSGFDTFKYNLSQICGRGFFRQLNRFGRFLRGR